VEDDQRENHADDRAHHGKDKITYGLRTSPLPWHDVQIGNGNTKEQPEQTTKNAAQKTGNRFGSPSPVRRGTHQEAERNRPDDKPRKDARRENQRVMNIRKDGQRIDKHARPRPSGPAYKTGSRSAAGPASRNAQEQPCPGPQHWRD
jgi:hypothetical protein